MLTFASYVRRFVKPLWAWYAGGFILLAVVNLINLAIPQLAKRVINALSAGQDLSSARGTALAIIGLGVLTIFVRTLSRVVIFWPGRRLETTTKSVLFGRILTLPEAFYTRFGMGDLISRLSGDIGQLRAFFAFGVLQIMNVAFLTVFTLAMMASVHLTLTLLTLLPLLAMVVITRYAMPRMHNSSRDNQQAVGDLTSRVTEAFVNVHVIQANAATASFAARVHRENERVFQTNMEMVKVRTLIFPMMTCLAGLSQLVVLFYGGLEVTRGHLTVGDILAFNVYIGLLTFPLTAMGIIIAVYQRAKTALERLSAIDEAEPEGRVASVRAEPGRAAAEVSPGKGQPLLEVRELTFGYDEGRPCLSGMSFTLAEGGRVGLFGRVGSGKSTLMNLITRLNDPPPGTVLLRGQDVRTLDPREIRRMAGYALQSVHLFSASIRSNLAFGMTPEPDLEQLREAARGAQILQEIEAFPQGWETEIGEKGVRLSGGQKQRLALARLLLRKPPLLLLDDVLSAVDHSTERRLIDHLYGMGSGLLIASHRGTALKGCDEVLILDQGRIVDRGDFASLARRYPELARDV